MNRILLYAREDGSVARTPQRQTFSIVDALISGEGNGPEAPDAIETNLVIAGPNFAAVDLVCAKIMGFDWHRIPHLLHVFDDHDLPIVDFRYEDIVVKSEIPAYGNRRLNEINQEDCFRFRPHFGWSNFIESRDEVH